MSELLAQLSAQLHQLTLLTIFLRLSLALLFGGLIGLEREKKRRPAGFRTYMLVCLGAALTMLLSQYISLVLSKYWLSAGFSSGSMIDISRMGSQVINGIGFLGAGTILVSPRQEIKGITTAAGLWASACTGLAIGAGFYTCMLWSFGLMFLCIRVFPWLENAVLAHSRNMNLCIEFSGSEDVGQIIPFIKSLGIRIFDMEWEPRQPGAYPCVILTLRLPPRQAHSALMAALAAFPCVRAIEET
jgi:putative Mg2+ transporter-C (MgtC) family protein